MAKNKYSPAQQRLGALDVNDDILKDKCEKLIEENKKITVESTLQKEEIESLKNTIKALDKKYKKLQLDNNLLKKAAKKKDGDDCDDRFDFKSYFAKYIKSGTQDGFNKEMVRLLSDRKVLLNASRRGLTRGLAGPMSKERVNKIKGMLAKDIGRGFLNGLKKVK